MFSYPPTLAFCIIATVGSVQAIQTIVTNNLDDGTGSLRAAIAAATKGETIIFAPALDGTTITLTSGQLIISGLEVTIDASSLPSGLSISGNNASRVLAITGTSNVTLRSLTIRGGSAINQNGGGVFVADGNVQMLDCNVRECFASYNGGGVSLGFGVTATLERCRIVGNTSSNLGFGGGLFVGGASYTLIRNCAVSGNSNPLGGGIAVSNSSPLIRNCTIQGNSGGGMYCFSSSTPHIENTIVWGNNHTSGTPAARQLKSTNGSLPVLSYSLVEGASGAASFGAQNPVTWGSGNLNVSVPSGDPKFVKAINSSNSPHSGGDLRLLATSPTLNAGNNLANPGSLDAAGSPRIQDTIVDLGAYEGGFTSFALLYPTLAPGGDENHNGIQNLEEYGMGYDPNSAWNDFPSQTFSNDGTDTFLAINQRSNAFDLSIFVQTSTSLDDSWVELSEGIHYTAVISTPVSSNRIQQKFSLIAGDPKRFYRQGFVIKP